MLRYILHQITFHYFQMVMQTLIQFCSIRGWIYFENGFIEMKAFSEELSWDLFECIFNLRLLDLSHASVESIGLVLSLRLDLSLVLMILFVQIICLPINRIVLLNQFNADTNRSHFSKFKGAMSLHWTEPQSWLYTPRRSIWWWIVWLVYKSFHSWGH